MHVEMASLQLRRVLHFLLHDPSQFRACQLVFLLRLQESRLQTEICPLLLQALLVLFLVKVLEFGVVRIERQHLCFHFPDRDIVVLVAWLSSQPQQEACNDPEQECKGC